ncbi:MAG: hypothetical protein WC340_10240 [Kiritimatiellia bacterium]
MAKNKVFWLAGVVFCVFMVLYALTAQRGVSWQDSGEFQYRLLAGDYYWNSGIARAHPLYILLGQGFVALFPLAWKLYACSLFSGVCMALALAVLFVVVVRITASYAAGGVTVMTAGLSHMGWWLSAVAEVYTLSLLFIMVELLVLLLFTQRRTAGYLMLLFAVNGAHFSVHNAALLGLPVYGTLLLMFLMRDFKRNLAGCCSAVLLWIAAGGMIWWQVVRLLGGGSAVIEVIESILFGDGYRSHVTGIVNFNAGLFLSNMALAAVSFVSPCWFLAPAGMRLHKRFANPLFFRALTGLTLIHLVFWVRYFVPDQVTFVLPLIGVLAIWGGAGCAALQRRFRVKYGLAVVVALGLIVNLGFLSVAPLIVKKLQWGVRRSRVLPGRDEVAYWIQPWKQNEGSAQDFVESVGKVLGSGDILYADSTTAAPLMAAREVVPESFDFELLSPWSAIEIELIKDAISRGHFYVVSPVRGYAPEWLLGGRYDFRERAVVKRVLKADSL